MVPVRVWQRWLQQILNGVMGEHEIDDNTFIGEINRALVEVVNCNPSIEEFEEWLEEALPNVYWQDSRNSPLHVIARYNKTSNAKTAAKLARALISAGHDGINHENINQATALDSAILSRNEEVALVLLEAGADIDRTRIVDGYDRNPLRLALIHACPKVVEKLIQLGCDVRSSSPLRTFFEHRSSYTTAKAKTVIKLLVDAGARIEHMSDDLWNLMLQAIDDEHIHTAHFLVQRADYYREKKETFSFKSLLFDAARNLGDSYLVIKLIVEKLVDLEAVDDSGNTLLRVTRDYDIVKFMIDNGAWSEYLLASHFGLLCTAVENRSYEMIDFLLQLKPDVDLEQKIVGYDFTILMYAVFRRNQNNVIIRFLDLGAKIGAKCPRGRGVLYYAAYMHLPNPRYVDVLELLISRGAAADLTEGELMEIFYSIVQCNNVNFVHMYLERFLDKSKFTEHDFRKLANYAALNMFTSKVLKYFIEEGGLDINSRGNAQNTFLHTMVFYNSEKLSLPCLKYLLKNGFDLRNENSEGITALHALNQTHQFIFIPLETRVECIRLILKYHSDYVNNELNLEEVRRIEVSETEELYNLYFYIVKHIAALEVNGKPVDQRNRVIINTNPYILNFYIKCKAELSVMQEHEICNGLTFFHVMMDAKRFSRNKNVIEAFENQSFLSKFNIYRDDLVKNFEEARKRPKLIENAHLVLQRIFPRHSLCVVWENVCKYLRNKDLRNLNLIIKLEEK